MWQDQLVLSNVVVPKVEISLCQSQKYMFGKTFHTGLLRTFGQRWKCTLYLKILWKLPYLHLCPEWNKWQKLSVIWMVNSPLNFLQNNIAFLFTFLWNLYVAERCTALVTLWKHLRGSWRRQSCQILLFLGNKSKAELLHIKCTSGTFSNGYDFIDELRGAKISDFMMVLSFSYKNRCKICSARKCYLNVLCILCS